MKTALYTTFYRAASNYLAAWYESVRAQSDQNFDIWISLDDISVREAEECVGCPISAVWLKGGPGNSPAVIRSQALQMLVREYDCIVLTDADDVLGERRIEAANRAIESRDVVGCALRLIDQRGRDLDRVFAPDPCAQLEELLSIHNVFGLSNTAYCARTLERCLPIPQECVLSDWYLATRAWCAGARLGFDRVPHMYYRQHGSNTAGVLSPFSEARILKATELVLAHYDFVLAVPGAPANKRKKIKAAQRRAQLFYRSIKDSPGRLAVYTRALNALEPKYVWWWCVANSELEQLWKN
jgi:hypothetical protein